MQGSLQTQQLCWSETGGRLQHSADSVAPDSVSEPVLKVLRSLDCQSQTHIILLWPPLPSHTQVYKEIKHAHIHIQIDQNIKSRCLKEKKVGALTLRTLQWEKKCPKELLSHRKGELSVLFAERLGWCRLLTVQALKISDYWVPDPKWNIRREDRETVELDVVGMLWKHVFWMAYTVLMSQSLELTGQDLHYVGTVNILARMEEVLMRLHPCWGTFGS